MRANLEIDGGCNTWIEEYLLLRIDTGLVGLIWINLETTMIGNGKGNGGGVDVGWGWGGLDDDDDEDDDD